MTVTFAPHQRLSMLIHARSKQGKSTLSATAPQPILVLDAEGSWRFIPVRQVFWDPAASAPPIYDGMWDVCIVTVSEWNTVSLVYRWMSQSPAQMPFVSVVLDSITEVQRRCKSNLKGTDAMRIQDWGVLLSVMDQVIRGFRDLCLMPTSNVRCVVFISETRQNTDGRWVPSMQGQIANSLPYWVDICGLLLAEAEADANGQLTQEVRRLWIGPHSQFESGERVQGRLGNSQIVRKPSPGQIGQDITLWMQTVFGVYEEVRHESGTTTG